MKITKAKVEANRARIVEAATDLFRAHGYDGVGVADLMAAAGLTHGGFYRHFEAKTDLMAEAACKGFGELADKAAAIDAADFVDEYLSRAHRDAPGHGCAMAALAGDTARQPEVVKEAFASGIERLLAVLAAADGGSDCPEPVARARRIATMSQIVGAMVLSRACPDDSVLAEEILEVSRRAVLPQLRTEK
ncbi:TetR/AcrR family transcriptional regulator [Massilia sp. TN1-12]|uniref:TetR/AcrR family transcriptional regulator n=1 Tax=Massilia paldalensis TaxID=3377675 RepID=UPI0038513DCD